MTDTRPPAREPAFEENVLWVFERMDMQPPSGAIEHRRPGHLFREGWFLDFVWGEQDAVEYFEYLILHRHPGYDRYRLHADGRWEPMNLVGSSGGYSYSADATAEEREELRKRSVERSREWGAEIDQLGLSTEKYDHPESFRGWACEVSSGPSSPGHLVPQPPGAEIKSRPPTEEEKPAVRRLLRRVERGEIKVQRLPLLPKRDEPPGDD